MSTEYLRRRGNQHWLKLPVPRPLRHLFLSSTGKPMVAIEQPLGDAYEQARVECARRVATYRELFARLKAGERMTPEQIKTALSGQHPRVTAARAAYPSVASALDAAPQVLLEALAEKLGMSLAPAPSSRGETISQAATAWIKELTADPRSAPRPLTIEAHRKRAKVFIEARGDLLLTAVTRAMASDFLAGLKVSNATLNDYATTLQSVFDSARKRGRFQGENPFDDMKRKATGGSYVPFTIDELRTLFAKLPREIAPAKHTPASALSWATLIALYTGARLEEIAQLTTTDVRNVEANGSSVWVIDIHNGGQNKLKNESAARLVPVHSALVRAGFLDYVKALPAGPLFPGLRPRASKGNKLGPELSSRFGKLLNRLSLKREGLCFHSFRHNVAGALDAAGVPQSDAARILGHAVAGMSYGTYSQAGPGLKRVAAVVEQITYEGLRL
jgi:integrase